MLSEWGENMERREYLGRMGEERRKMAEQPKYIVCMYENRERAKFMNKKENASD